jgi:hypothetical protein
MYENLFETCQMKWKDLVPNGINPRKVKQAELKKLWERIRKFGLVGIPSVDFEGKLLGGEQRALVHVLYGQGERLTDVRRAVRPLTEDERREIIIIENHHAGENDLDKLLAEFAEFVDLDEFGIDIAAADELAEKALEKTTEPEMPIVPKYSEKYSAVIIVIENSIDENFVLESLGLGVQKDYKNENFGQSYVMTAKQFADRWKFQ